LVLKQLKDDFMPPVKHPLTGGFSLRVPGTGHHPGEIPRLQILLLPCLPSPFKPTSTEFSG